MANLLLYGGTFDPIHHGHLITCRAACEALGAARVLLVPAWLSPHKKDGPPTATAPQRLQMARIAVDGQDDFAAEPAEIERGEKGGVSYTFDTVQQLQQERPADAFTLLIGEDQLPKFHLWHRVRELLERVPVAVMTRGPSAGTGLKVVRQNLGPAADRLRLLPTPRIDISATAIRQRVAAGLTITHLVPPGVAAYIARQGLYLRPGHS